MAEKSTELERVSDDLDPISTAGGAKDSYLDPMSIDPEYEASDELDETEHIKAQIEATRSQMGETIDAIQDRLSFANISEQVSETVSNAIETAKDTAYDATIGKAVNFMRNVGDGVTHSGAFKTVRSNPFPFALIGLGAGLLAYQAYSGRGHSRFGNGRDRRSMYDRGEGHDEPSRFDSAKRSIGSVANKTYEGISDTASTAVESVKGAASTAYEGVAGAVSTAYSGANDLAQKAYDRAGEYGTIAYDKYDHYLEENPLALGAIALAAGAAVGFAIPSTQLEGRLMGDARDNLMQKAQDAAGSLVDRAKRVATEAGETIKEL